MNWTVHGGEGTALAAGRRAFHGELPSRYYGYYDYRDGKVRAHFLPLLVPGAQVLDIGSGKHPFVLPKQRPDGVHYVGLDVSEDELARAPVGSYDETALADATIRVPSFEGRFDVVLSRWLLEHVRPVDVALENFRSYLRPGGRFAAYLAGRYSIGAIANRVLGPRLSSAALSHLTSRTPDSTFPAHYESCAYRSLVRMGQPWTDWEVVPIYENARYLDFSRFLQALYITYEEMLMRYDRRNLATHYIILGDA